MSGTIPIDEMVDGQGGVRPQWRHLLSILSELGHADLLGRRQQIALALSDQTGILSSPSPLSGLISADEKTPEGPVGVVCDPIPLILKNEEFAALEKGVIQRARLLESLLRDIYGERSVLRDHLLPPALVWGNQGFLRGGNPDGGEAAGHFISCYAVDLVREPDGCWRVLADRVDRGNGIGLAIENRRQMARAIPEIFSSQPLRRLGSFLDRWQDGIQRPGSGESTNPSVALLTPGPASPHWGEHVILARELGCSLVETADLTVREGQLWLKTVRGLRRIDVLFIRQGGGSIDPLELDSVGPGGVSGLLDAARSGSVRLINDPRSGFAEALGLAPFLPRLTGWFLGEDPLLETIETVWLGDPETESFRERLLGPAGEQDGGHADRWVITSALGSDRTVQRLSILDDAKKAQLAEKVRHAPWRYVAYREPLASLSPTVGESAIVPRPIVLRLFAIQEDDGWTVLPGGVARVFESGEPVTVEPIRVVQTTKDVWVTVDEHVTQRGSSLVAHRPLAIRRDQADLPSRAADDFFWLGRYLEQIESGARLLHVTLAHIAGPDPSPRERADLEVLMRQMQATGIIHRVSMPGYGMSNIARNLAGTGSPDGYFARTLRKIIRLGPELADRLTQDVRDYLIHRANAILESFVRHGRSGDPTKTLDHLFSGANDLLVYSATLSGFVAENMVRSGGRQFLDLGRRIERASSVLLDCASVLDQPDVHQRGRMEGALRLMLELGDSVITYRSRYFSVVQPAPVLDLLLLDEDNPRGVGFQLTALRDSLAALVSDSPSVPAAQQAASRELAAAAEAIRVTLADLVNMVISADNQDAAAASLPAAIREAQRAVMSLSEQIGRCYFSVLNSPRLVGIGNDATIDDSMVGS
ncbi:circularly permuted type 2 ATP-grasp protein [Acetobacter conturbans]|uniref:DUF403 domain-containing protein n=1 Tax=Acetobacter conturbans TaxID=1737472 RepID=A0ABX0JXN1_9PROT|nr:circularly permuted type 2 ATP-grasp protein [Acetobacter conturbans]NHN88216.1 hypothetical protein [Acetobacter conturbans]